MKDSRRWIFFVVVHVIFMGVWGALVEISDQYGFPPTLGYVVWSLTMIPASVVALKMDNWKLDKSRKAIIWGGLAGLLGAGGQLALFFVLRIAPAYLVFPLLSLTPVVTILLAVLFLGERTSKLGWIGISLAIVAILLLSYTPSGNESGVSSASWILLSAIPLLAWGTQGYVMRVANETIKAESIFFYMMVGSLVLAPFALLFTDFSQDINWGFTGPYLSAMIQILNAFGALCLVYAFRYGKAIIIAPMTTALSPVLTVIISLFIYAVFPNAVVGIGMVLAIVAALLMGKEEDKIS